MYNNIVMNKSRGTVVKLKIIIFILTLAITEKSRHYDGPVWENERKKNIACGGFG